MAGNSRTDQELQAIHRELRELNRRLDRICRAYIFSLDKPVLDVEITKITTPIMEGENPEQNYI